MASDSGSGKKTGNARRRNTRKKDHVIEGSNHRIAATEKQVDLIRHTPVGIYEIDFNGPRIKNVNDYICQVMGYTREEMLEMSPFDLLDDEGKARFRERIRKHLAGEDVGDLVEYRGRAKDGRAICWLLKIALTRVDGVAEGAIVVGQDITGRKLVEEALRESEERYRKLFDSIDEAFELIEVIRDENGRVVDGIWLDVNPAYDKHAGISRVGLVGQRLLQRFPEIDPAWWDVYDRVEKTGISEELVNYSEYTDRYYEGNYFRFGPGKVGITFRDITERKRAEDELKEAKARAELYLDLMGHDINNMHQIALGYLEIVEGMMPHKDSRRELLKKSVEVLQRSTRLIQNVRKLQGLNDGMFHACEVDVCQVLADVQREFGAVPRKTITLNLNGCDHCHVRANELMHDIFANLVSNAIKHTGEQAVINISLEIINDEGGRHCRVSVEDNGPGIPDDSKRAIFDRMLKVTNKAKGWGLGLYLVKSLVESYGGTVAVEDRVPGDHSKGARFVVTLPVLEQ